MAKKKNTEHVKSALSKNNKPNKKSIKHVQVSKKKRSEKSYTVQNLQDALNALRNGQTLRQAAHAFGVPKSTLLVKSKCSYPLECRKGPSTILSESEEMEIERWILFSAEAGFPVTKSRLLDCVQTYVAGRSTPFKNNRPGSHWYRAFMRRHPTLSHRIAQNLTSTRAAVSEEDLREWFKKVKLNLEQKNLINIEADRVFNLDESSFMLVPKDNKVLTAKGAKAPYQIVSGNEKASLTVLFTISASGRMPPPMILFDLKTAPRKNVLDGIPSGWGVGNTERGWMTAESFYKYIENIFFKWLKENNYVFPVVLYVDGHCSHMTLPLLRFCKQNQIELIVLYPNATHIIQPLDVAIFHPLKDAYRKVLRQWRIDNDVVNFKKYMFAPVLKLALDSCDLTAATKNGFRACGLYPLNADAVDYNILNKKCKKKDSSVPPVSRNEAVSSDVIKSLEIFEKYIISPATLEDFKKAEVDDTWTGDLRYYELFQSWVKLKKLCSGIEVESPINLVSDETIEPELEVEIAVDTTTDSFETESSSLAPIESLHFPATEALNISTDTIVEIIPPNSLILNMDNCDDMFNPKNFQKEYDNLPISEIEILDQSGNRMTAAVIEVIPDVTKDSDSSSDRPILSKDNSDEIQLSMDELEDQENSSNGFTTDTDSNNLKRSCNQESSSDAKICDFPSTNEDFTNSNNATMLNENYIMDLSKTTKDRNDFSNFFTSSKLNFNSTNNYGHSNVVEISNLEFNPKKVSAPGVFDYTLGALSNSSEACINNVNCSLSISEESNSSICSTESKNEAQSPTIKECFSIPTFTCKKKKGKTESGTHVAIVDDLLQVLQKKENDKEEKKRQTLLNKQEREKARALKEIEQNVVKSFNENKRKKLQEKKDIKAEILTLKQLIKSKNNKENQTELHEKMEKLNGQLDQIQNDILSQDMQLLQTKMKIKKEKL